MGLTPAAKISVLAGGLGVACAAPVLASEWSVQPALGLMADYHSNRSLQEEGRAGDSVATNLDLLLARRTETSEILVRPHLRVQKFSDDVREDLDDRRLSVGTRWDFERAQLRIGGTMAEESTLTTELTETGLVSADAARRTNGGDVAWSFTVSPSRLHFANLSHSDVRYTGGYDGRLFGYRYSALSVGESIGFSERVRASLTGTGSRLESPARGSESQERLASVGIDFDWTERTSMSASLGYSWREIDGRESTGTNRDFSLIHEGETRGWSLQYSHSLVPYGTGVLTERDNAALKLTQHFTSRLQAGLNLGFARNRDTGMDFVFDSRTYRYADVEVRWRLRESLNVSAVAGVGSASELYSTQGNVEAWSFALRSNWTPRARSFGH